MDKQVATLILTSLCERANDAGATIVLTSAERQAIQRLFGPETPNSIQGFAVPKDLVNTANEEVHKFSPAVEWRTDEPADERLLLCLDFGTSFSKAFLSKSDDFDDAPILIDVTFGVNTEGHPQFLLPSELFIHGNELLFGSHARRKFDVVEAVQDRLIDNPKQYMTLGTDITNLHQKPLRKDQDPSQRLSQRDVLVLYLAHLNRMVDLSLEESEKPVEVLRRYTHPAWEKSSQKANSEAMARIMAEAVALARLYPEDFSEKTTLDRAVKLADAARSAEKNKLPFHLLKNAVREATAAGAGALMQTNEGKRQGFVILDIGAGTTDVAGCLCVNDQRTGELRVAEIMPASQALAQAGNSIDNALLKEILETSSLAKGTTEYDRALQTLRKSIRALKESLFNDGFVFVSLPTGESVEIELSDFLKTQAIGSLFEKIKTIVSDAALLVAGSEHTVYLVPTGGGARLPIVGMLIKDPILKADRHVQLRLREAMPDALKLPYPTLVPIYPQLAVAVGGSLPLLPTQINSVSEGIVDPGKKTLQPVYRAPYQD